MFEKTVISVSVLLAVVALILPAGASAAGGAIVFSEVTTPLPLGPDGEPVFKPSVGGLYAFERPHRMRLTTDPADHEPAFSADGRTIVFVRAGDIWAMRADGSGQRQLTSGSDVDSRPLVAPNGRYVLFQRRARQRPGHDLYTSDLRGQGVHPLAATPGEEREAAFSPDGRQIVYVRRDKGGRRDIWSIRPSGIGVRRLTRTSRVNDFGPRYLGRTIVFSRGSDRRNPESHAAIYAMNRRGERVRKLIAGAGSVHLEDVNARTRAILFARGGSLWVKRLGGRGRKLVSFPKRGSTTGVFSPDGRHIASLNEEIWGQSLSVLDTATGHRAYGVTSASNVEGGERNGYIGRIVAWQPVPQRH